jgi:cyclophilin family peptidyl-prolyl cis-trans isomerase
VKLHYEGTAIHRVVPGFLIQVGGGRILISVGGGLPEFLST